MKEFVLQLVLSIFDFEIRNIVSNPFTICIHCARYKYVQMRRVLVALIVFFPMCGSWCLVSLPRVSMRWSVIVAFPGHAHLLYEHPLSKKCKRLPRLILSIFDFDFSPRSY